MTGAVARPLRSIAVVLSLALLAPHLVSVATGADAPEEAPDAAAIEPGIMGVSVGPDPTDAWGGLSLAAGADVSDADDPGAPFGFPNDNTYGYTTDSGDLDRTKSDVSGGVRVQVDMGKMARKAKLSGEKDYILELVFDMWGYYWFDYDGKFDPVNGAHDGLGDDPCPEAPFKLFTVHVNGQKIRTVEGENHSGCTPGGSEFGRTFAIKTVGDDPPYWVRIPKGIVREGANDVYLEIHDMVLPAYQAYHSKYSDGWHMHVATAMIELAAPPLILSHGWSNEWDPATGTVAWQPTFKANIKSEMGAHFGQDPWRWARIAGKDAIKLNFYDKKQDFRKSARELRGTLNGFYSDLGYSGKGWIHGHSMGGLMTRYYVEALGGSAKIEKLAQTGSPNLGSWEAHAYTYGFWLNYEAQDGDYTAKWHWTLPGWPFDCCVEVWHGWRDWWNPSIWAWEHWEGPGHGREHIADFSIKPPGSNPILAGLNGLFPAAGVQYFTVRGDCSVFTSKSCALSGYHWRGDGAVSLDSATMNGAIRHRTIDAFHEDIPAMPDTSRWMVRYWTGLDLDNGRPGSGPGFYPTGGLVEAPSAAGLDTGGAGAPGSEGDEPATMTDLGFLSIRPEDVATGAFEHRVLVEAAPTATFAVLARPTEGVIDVRLRAPDGTTYGPDAPEGSGVTYASAPSTFAKVTAYEVANPAAGEWTILIDPADQPPTGGIPLLATSFVDSTIEMRAFAGNERYRVGDAATILARVTDAGAPLAGIVVTATLSTFEGEPAKTTLALLDDGQSGDGAAGDGVYGARWTAPAEGAFRFDVLASGEGAAGAFERSGLVELVVASLPDLTVTAVAGAPEGAWGGESVTLSATVASVGEREARGVTTVSFFDGAPDAGGVLIGTAAVTEDIPVGESRTVTLDAVAPPHALDLHVIVDAADVEADLLDNAASAVMPFVPSPRTVASVAGEPGANGWVLGPATVTIGAYDGSVGAYAETWYVLGDGAPASYVGPITVAEEGDHLLSFYSVDTLGNVEPLRSTRVKVDLAAPTAALENPSPGQVHVADVRFANPRGFTAVVGVVDVQVSASDSGAGVSRVLVNLDGEPHAEAALSEDGLYSVLWDSTKSSVGNHVLSWTVEDGAGRVVGGEQRVYVVVGRAVEVEKDPAANVARLTPGGA